MNTVMIIPTGMGCAIGGHAGDATPAAKLLAQVSDKLVLHPNVVNASDINEMPANSLYVEGSILDRFLEGKVNLQEVYSNKILVVVNLPLKPETVNAINAARVTLGADIKIVELLRPLEMTGWVEGGVAGGSSAGVRDLIAQVKGLDFDALAIASPISVPEDVVEAYLTDDSAGVNPWGKIEADVSREIANAINKPVAHAPVESDATKENYGLFNILYSTVVAARKAPEVCSSCYIHCVLKGLHKAPRMVGPSVPSALNQRDVSVMVSPDGLVGRPHEACFKAGIPVIAVKDNTSARTKKDSRIIYVENYLEAAGVIACMGAGVLPRSVMSDGT